MKTLGQLHHSQLAPIPHIDSQHNLVLDRIRVSGELQIELLISLSNPNFVWNQESVFLQYFLSKMEVKKGMRRQLSTGSIKKSGKLCFHRQQSFDPKLLNGIRFHFGRQSSLDPNRRVPGSGGSALDELTVPGNLDSTMLLLFMSSQGDTKGVDELLKEGIDVNSIDLDGRTALHIAACEGHVDVVKLLLRWRANIDARDRWGSTAAADAKFYGNDEVYSILKSRGAKVPKIRKTPMTVSNPREVPEYELKPGELQFRRGDGIVKARHISSS
ncbi:serine/threonine-protein kinase STY17-like [Iris pallida]|uniref:Serine/threonine-protein kinase STY17-like n=1 Tax=Iris pallida TaxID=29817 RepID=A0AAX6EQF6_IRIPA|nr:serine/threonine-protein kinase STY17-like [Iris pallida]KAJ6836151.1 serine/threonine-protein kinase STY17-like [Iris pallida]